MPGAQPLSWNNPEDIATAAAQGNAQAMQFLAQQAQQTASVAGGVGGSAPASQGGAGGEGGPPLDQTLSATGGFNAAAAASAAPSAANDPKSRLTSTRPAWNTMQGWLAKICYETRSTYVGSAGSMFQPFTRRAWVCIEVKAQNSAAWDEMIRISGDVFAKDLKGRPQQYRVSAHCLRHALSRARLLARPLTPAPGVLDALQVLLLADRSGAGQQELRQSGAQRSGCVLRRAHPTVGRSAGHLAARSILHARTTPPS